MSTGDHAAHRQVRVYRSSRVSGMFLLVDAKADLEPVPEDLLTRFGTPVESFTFELTTTRKLARVDAAAVLHAIAGQGYFLQLPPVIEPAQRNGNDER